MAATARTPLLPEATPVGPQSAQMRRPPSQSRMAASRARRRLLTAHANSGHSRTKGSSRRFHFADKPSCSRKPPTGNSCREEKRCARARNSLPRGMIGRHAAIRRRRGQRREPRSAFRFEFGWFVNEELLRSDLAAEKFESPRDYMTVGYLSDTSGLYPQRPETCVAATGLSAPSVSTDYGVRCLAFSFAPSFGSIAAPRNRRKAKWSRLRTSKAPNAS